MPMTKSLDFFSLKNGFKRLKLLQICNTIFSLIVHLKLQNKNAVLLIVSSFYLDTLSGIQSCKIQLY